MADTAPSIVVAQMVTLIEALSEIGVVLPVQPWHHDDIGEQIVSDIGGVEILRAWWIQGPSLEAAWLGEYSPQHVARVWTYEIHALEGLAPAYEGDVRLPGEDLLTLRDNMTRVCDALDADHDLGLAEGVIFKSEPCQITDDPTHVSFADGVVTGSYGVITKVIKTVPAR